jgi:hypothetical protein
MSNLTTKRRQVGHDAVIFVRFTHIIETQIQYFVSKMMILHVFAHNKLCTQQYWPSVDHNGSAILYIHLGDMDSALELNNFQICLYYRIKHHGTNINLHRTL